MLKVQKKRQMEYNDNYIKAEINDSENEIAKKHEKTMAVPTGTVSL